MATGTVVTVKVTLDAAEQFPFVIVQVRIYVPPPPAGVKTAPGFVVLLN